MKSINHGLVWKIVKEVRLHYLQENASALCDPISSLLNEKDVHANTMKVGEKIGLNITDNLLENVPESTLQTAGDMFIYLNSCPPPILGLYKELFENASSREIILTLRGILGTSREGEKDIAVKIWSKITNEMKMNYKWIEKVTKEYSSDGNANNNVDDKSKNNSNSLHLYGLLLHH